MIKHRLHCNTDSHLVSLALKFPQRWPKDHVTRHLNWPVQTGYAVLVRSWRCETPFPTRHSKEADKCAPPLCYLCSGSRRIEQELHCTSHSHAVLFERNQCYSQAGTRKPRDYQSILYGPYMKASHHACSDGDVHHVPIYHKMRCKPREKCNVRAKIRAICVKVRRKNSSVIQPKLRASSHTLNVDG